MPIGFSFVSTDLLKQSPFWLREFAEDEEFNEFVESVKRLGIIEPLIVRQNEAGDLEIVCGHRRLFAARKAGLTQIPIIIQQVSDEQALEAQFSENIHRKDLTDMEKAHYIKKIIDKFGFSQKELAKKIGKSEVWISRHLQMLKLEKEKEAQIGEITPGQFGEFGEISEKQAREILKVPEVKRAEILEKVAEKAKEEGKIPSAEKIKEIVRPQFVECDHCHVSISLHKQWHGHVLCEGCFAKAELDPKGFDLYFRYLEKAKAPAVKPETWKPDTAKESWAFREARMKPQVSAFEVKFNVEAVKAGLPYGESHVPVCVRETVPDKTYQLPKGVLHVFFDGKTVHEGHEDRDEALRDVLRKRGETVLSITYERVTEEALQSAVEQVRAELLRLGWTPKQQEA